MRYIQKRGVSVQNKMAASKPEDRDDIAEAENTRAREKGQLLCGMIFSILTVVLKPHAVKVE